MTTGGAIKRGMILNINFKGVYNHWPIIQLPITSEALCYLGYLLLHFRYCSKRLGIRCTPTFYYELLLLASFLEWNRGEINCIF